MGLVGVDVGDAVGPAAIHDMLICRRQLDDRRRGKDSRHGTEDGAIKGAACTMSCEHVVTRRDESILDLGLVQPYESFCCCCRRSLPPLESGQRRASGRLRVRPDRSPRCGRSGAGCCRGLRRRSRRGLRRPSRSCGHQRTALPSSGRSSGRESWRAANLATILKAVVVLVPRGVAVAFARADAWAENRQSRQVKPTSHASWHCGLLPCFAQFVSKGGAAQHKKASIPNVLTVFEPGACPLSVRTG